MLHRDGQISAEQSHAPGHQFRTPEQNARCESATPFEGWVQGLAHLRVPDKEPDLLLQVLIPGRVFGPDLPAGGGKVRMDNNPVIHASISLKKSSIES